MRRVVFNQKGGVGKSSITTNLAAIAAHQGKRTLLVDLDPQGNSSQYLLGAGADNPETTIADFFRQTLSFRLTSKAASEFTLRTPYENLDLVCASPELTELENRLESRHKIYKLRDALVELDGPYDAIFIDTAPALNFFTLAALIASHSCLIPFDCDDFSRRALYSLMDRVAETRDDHNRELQVEGIIVNQFMPRANLPQRVVSELQDEGMPILQTRLSSSVKMRESHEQAMPLIHLAPRHKLTLEYLELYGELAAA